MAGQGWSKQYEFSETDFSNALDTINLWVDATAAGRSNIAPEKIPWAALRELIASTCYGGRVDNEFDLRSLESLLQRLFTPESYGLSYSLLLNSSPDNNQPTLPEGKGRAAFLGWAHELPEAQVPAWLGLPEDADVVLLTQQAQTVLDAWLQLQASQAGAELAYNPEEAEAEAEGPKWCCSPPPPPPRLFTLVQTGHACSALVATRW
jgi:dynein heavy chain 1